MPTCCRAVGTTPPLPPHSDCHAAVDSDFDADAAGRRFVVGQFGESHEADALIGILLEHRDLGRGLPTWYFAGDQFTEVTDLVPGDNAGLDRFEQIGL